MTIQVCTFHCSGRWFGIPLIDIKEVAIAPLFASVPHTPPEIRGLVNIRGQILLVLDLPKLLGLAPGRKPSGSSLTDQRLIIFKAAVGPSFGIVVEEVGEISTCDEGQTELLETLDFGAAVENDRSALVRCTCNDDHRVLILLEPRHFLPFVENTLFHQN